jgi:hypothetical protein
MYCLMMVRGALLEEAAKLDGDQKCFPHRNFRTCGGYCWGSRRRRDAFERVDQHRYREARRVVHEQVDVIGRAVELAQLGAQARRCLP